MKKRPLILLALLTIILVLQFFRGELPDTSEDNPDDLISNHLIEDEVVGILKSACYDCHSNESIYPWYSYVAPVSWLIIRDTRLGREELNFSEWNSFSKKRKLHKLEEMGEEVEEGEMPFKPYMITHAEARLTDEQRSVLIAWSKSFAGSVQ